LLLLRRRRLWSVTLRVWRVLLLLLLLLLLLQELLWGGARLIHLRLLLGMTGMLLYMQGRH
jgi:hypothetical protein